MAKQNKGRKFFAASATAALVASAIVPVASAAQVNDLNKVSGYAKEAVQALVDSGVIQGDTKGNFNPLNTISRAEAAEIFAKALGLDASGDVNFKDVKAGAWYYNSITAVVEHGIFEGVSTTEFAPSKNLTRSEAAKILVEAFDLEGDASVDGFADASQIKPWAKQYLEIAVANGIFQGTDANRLNPNNSITRQDFALTFQRTLNLVDNETPEEAAFVKAINNTTVEVTFDQEVENVQALDFAIDGLEIKNASVKQSNKKVVVLTTASQTAEQEYVVTLDGEAIGGFKGIAAVVPTKVELVSSAVQGKLGQEVKLQAKVSVGEGQSKAGIPVTFSIPGNTNDAVAPTIVGEAVTNEEGIATYSYTRYKEGRDDVTAYATGDRSKFAYGYVFWGVDTILSIEEVTTGATINNGANKTYKITYKNPKTGKPEAGKTFNVGFAENMDVTSDKVANATVNGVKALQLSNGTALEAAQITTDSKGEATFTVSGTNTDVTPVVYDLHDTKNNTSNKKYAVDALQAAASKVKFAALQADYTLEITRADNAGEVAAIGATNGREYKVVVKDKAGNLAKNEIVNVAFNEDKDRVISTVTNAKFVDTDPDTAVYFTGDKAKQISVKTNDKGEATFVIGSEIENDYATPIAWIDINTADAKQGDLDEGEPKAVAPISYFQKAYLDGSAIKAYKQSDLTKAVTKFDGSETAVFAAELVNQSGKKMPNTQVKKATYTIYNTGANDIRVDGQSVSPNRSFTVTYEATLGTNGNVVTPAKNLEVTSVDGKTTSVRVIATGIAINTDGKDYAFTAKEATATFTATTEVPNSYTGVAAEFNPADSGKNSNTITFAGKVPVKYAGESGKTYQYFGANGNPIYGEAAWETLLDQYANATPNKQKVTLSYNVDGDTITFKVVSVVDTTAGDEIKKVTPTTVAPTTGVLTLTPALGGTVDLTGTPNTLGISLADADLNVSTTAIDNATVTLKDSANNTVNLTLVETGVNTGVFATTVQAGTLSSLAAGTLTVTYADAKNAAGVAQNITSNVTLKKTAGVLTSGTFTQAVLPSAATSAEATTRSIAADYTFATGEGFTLDIDATGTPVLIDLDGRTGAQGVAAAINAAFPGTATVSGDRVVIKSTTDGTTSEVAITATTVTQVLNAVVNGKATVAAATPASKTFTITNALAVGEKVVIDGVEYTAVAFGTAPTSTTFVAESAANTLDTAANQAAKLATAIQNNTADRFDAIAAGAVITLDSNVSPVTTITEPVITLK